MSRVHLQQQKTHAASSQWGCLWMLFKPGLTTMTRSPAAAQTVVVYCHLVSICGHSRTLRGEYMLGGLWIEVKNVLKGLFDLTFCDTWANLKGDEVLIEGKWRIFRRAKNWLLSERYRMMWVNWWGGKEMRGIEGEAKTPREWRDKTKWLRKCKGKIRKCCTRMQQPCLRSLFNYMPPTVSWIDSLRQWGKIDNIIENKLF